MKSVEELRQINFARMVKEVYLLCELVRLRGDVKIVYYKNINDKSSIIWNIGNEMTTKINEIQKQIWNDFLVWLVQ